MNRDRLQITVTASPRRVLHLDRQELVFGEDETITSLVQPIGEGSTKSMSRPSGLAKTGIDQAAILEAEGLEIVVEKSP